MVLDGVDVTAAGAFQNGIYQLVPSSDLGFGAHTVRVSATDRAGNAMPPVSWGFTVADLTPPQLGDVRPDPGSAGSDRTPVIALTLGDGDGTGIDPASVSMSVDGIDVSGQAQLTGSRLTYLPAAPLAFGNHTVVVNASDRAGNHAPPLSWTFTVRDETAPTVSGRQPIAGTTVPGAVRIAFDAADTGTGIDPSSLVVTVDGSDVTSWGTFAGGHFSYAPGNLGAGVHTIAVTVADAAGNVAGPVMWQFAVADPATLSLRTVSGPSALIAGVRKTLVFQASSGSTRLAGARLLVSHRTAGSAGYGPARALTASSAGRIALAIAPTAHHPLPGRPGRRSDSVGDPPGHRPPAGDAGRPAAAAAPRYRASPAGHGASAPSGWPRGRADAHPSRLGDRRPAAVDPPLGIHHRGRSADPGSVPVPGAGGRHAARRSRHQPHRRGAGSLSPLRVRAARQQPLARTRLRPPTRLESVM